MRARGAAGVGEGGIEAGQHALAGGDIGRVEIAEQLAAKRDQRLLQAGSAGAALRAQVQRLGAAVARIVVPLEKAGFDQLVDHAHQRRRLEAERIGDGAGPHAVAEPPDHHDRPGGGVRQAEAGGHLVGGSLVRTRHVGERHGQGHQGFVGGVHGQVNQSFVSMLNISTDTKPSTVARLVSNCRKANNDLPGFRVAENANSGTGLVRRCRANWPAAFNGGFAALADIGILREIDQMQPLRQTRAFSFRI